MPHYEYQCADGHVTTLRRPFEGRGLRASCGDCGRPAGVIFSPTNNLHVPISFRQVLADGSPGGGQYSWSDFHDVSERELARNPNIEPRARVLSRSTVVNNEPAYTMADAYREAKQMPEGMRRDVFARIANKHSEDTTTDE